MLDRITSEPSKRCGMFDQFSYGYLGFALGPDGKTIHYLTGGPIYIDGKRLAGKATTAMGEAKGLEDLHLVTYDIPTGKYTDHGAIFYENGQRPLYVNSIAVGKDGTVYTLAASRRTARPARICSACPDRSPGSPARKRGKGQSPARTVKAVFLAKAASFLAASLVAAQGGTQQPPPPNIVILLADDMGFSDLGCYGGEISHAEPRRAGGGGRALHAVLQHRPVLPDSRESAHGSLPAPGRCRLDDVPGVDRPGYRGDLIARRAHDRRSAPQRRVSHLHVRQMARDQR